MWHGVVWRRVTNENVYVAKYEVWRLLHFYIVTQTHYMLRNVQGCVGCNTVNGNVEELKYESKNRNLRLSTRVDMFSRARPMSEENRVG